MHLLELGRPKGLESVLAQVWEGSLGHSLIGKDDHPHIQKRNIAAPWLQKTSLLCQSLSWQTSQQATHALNASRTSGLKHLRFIAGQPP